MSDERRRFQRLTLVEPLDGWFGDFAVRLIDISASGALIEYDDEIHDQARGLLRFWWRGHPLELVAETKRTYALRAGLQFLEHSDLLERWIDESTNEILNAFEANARGDREANLIGDETLTSVWRRPASGYVRWMLTDGQWHSELASQPDQPPDGFTIAAGETEDQVALLCQTYEQGDEEARRMTRMLAEMSTMSR